MAKDYFKEKNVAYEEINVAEKPEEGQKMLEKTGQLGVPQIFIEKDGKEELEIVGLEAIRGDWVEAAQEFQRELLDKIFHKEEPTKFIKEYIKKILSGKLDSKLVYRKSIRKNLEDRINR